jgi:hypothetical protein
MGPMFKNSLRLLGLGTALVCSAGSATIIKGTSQPVTITTNPPGAQVFVDNQPVGVSPLTVTLKHDDHQVSATLPGYQPGYARLTSSFSGWTLLAFPAGTIVDAITGALATLDQDAVVINLGGGTPGQAPAYPQPATQTPPAGTTPERH